MAGAERRYAEVARGVRWSVRQIEDEINRLETARDNLIRTRKQVEEQISQMEGRANGLESREADIDKEIARLKERRRQIERLD